jgi:hypothetical protein
MSEKENTLVANACMSAPKQYMCVMDSCMRLVYAYVHLHVEL